MDLVMVWLKLTLLFLDTLSSVALVAVHAVVVEMAD